MELRSSQLCLWVWAFLVIFQSHRSLGCVDEERTALLEIKDSVGYPGRYFSSWVENKTSDYCAWERIRCSDTTGCVSQLFLDHVFDGYHFINASLFLPFKDLQLLDISWNYLDGWQSNQAGIEKLSKLKRLEVLELGWNSFNSSVLEPLSELTSLKTLHLGANKIGKGASSDISHGLMKISKLKRLEILVLSNNYLKDNVLAPLSELMSLHTLDLSYNQLGTGSSAQIFQGFCKLKKLYDIYLSWNHLKGNIPPCLENFTSLRTLDLSNNQFDGNIPRSLASNMTSLRILDLSKNQLTGSIPPLVPYNLTSLTVLDFSHNQLQGNIPQGLISNTASLRVLDFSENQLSGSISPFLVYNMTSLHVLSFSNNHLDGTTFVTSLHHLKPQLMTLGLANCNLNISTTIILKFLYLQHDLRLIDLSHNGIHGKFPFWLFVNNTMLEVLRLRNNSISGRIQFPVPASNLTWIDISDNHFEGHVQKNVGDLLSGVEHLNFSRNRLEGTIPTSLGNMALVSLDLSKNNFTGDIPKSLTPETWKPEGWILSGGLTQLILSDNRLHGLISPLLFNHTQMSTLRLNNNQFTGFVQIRNNNIGSFYFMTLDVSQNNISGRMPTWIGNLTNLRSLVLRDNSFGGPIPSELCNLAGLVLMDLSENEFSGSLPSCLDLPNLKFMHLQENKLSGPIPIALLRSSNLVTLDLNNNYFSGSIPGWLGSLGDLRFLLLKGNRLSGLLPRDLCKLSKIGILDLSLNGFSGFIPLCFGNITFRETEGIELDIKDTGGASEMSFDSGVTYDMFFYEFGSYVSQEEVYFVTKNLYSSYKGYVLKHMAGMDLSCNSFMGEIPHELGSLTGVRALNLSYNQFMGPIPRTLSKLKQLESMDLSHNRLSGEVPLELSDITTLEVFLVAYNNLSGRLPDMKAQFSTFTETSYEGNPYLCGPPLLKQCDTEAPTGSETVTAAGLSEKFGIDLISFLASSVAACMTSLLALVIVLYINPYWRRLWFDSVDACLSFVFPFWSEAIYRVSNPFT